MTGVLRGYCSVGAFALAAALCLTPAAADAKRKPAPRAPAPMLSFGAFTPAAADPRLAAAFARNGLGTANFQGGAFRFTPSISGGKRRAITVAVRARAVGRTDAGKALQISPEIAPSAYSLGVSVGWKRFAVSGDVAKLTGGLAQNGHEAADIGLSFEGKRWATKLDVAADRDNPEGAPQLGIDQSWSVGLGGTYALTHSIDLSGGVRYKTQRDQFQITEATNKRDSQSVYLGTTFKF
ncbi:hypothetical protein FHS31_000982 [Sphingomonas vulcanisoli]|uniref:Porin domain-containing protein n=1 Tax=Sphingomonas vulcanisoli TaxID=1658060 RepID=A0ABX0TPN7_9SPHN|nr:porin [Sphingomonas vulcanisoli]NIJ07386.1 hypothetical protein [Sphingomonas vulcanisoli]